MKITIILPTYNNEKTLEECLQSIRMQKFPAKDYELLVIDGGSSDRTLTIAKRYDAVIINNPDRVEEKARILGISKAKGELILFVDADNVLEGKDWLTRMAKPFEDKEIIFADTLYYGYRKKDLMKVRYQALVGGDDPLANYLGLYSRWCYFRNDWTDFPYVKEIKRGYWKVKLLDKNLVPAMGSNGFIIRTSVLRKFVKNSFIHSDIVYDLVNKGYNCFAKVDASIVHNQPTFFKNKIRRIQRRLKKQVDIRYNYGVTSGKTARVLLRSMLILPVIYDMVKGYIRKPNSAWLFHPIALYGLIGIHVYYRTLGRLLKA